MSLYNAYADVIGDVNAWDYYRGNPDDILQKCKQRPNIFITQYFKHGEKEKVVDNALIRKISRERQYHVISVFFLGILIYRNSLRIRQSIDSMTKAIESSLPAHRDDDDSRCFLYVWFLTCLFHDIGYCYEGLPCPDCSVCNRADLNPLFMEIDEIPCNDFIPAVFRRNIKHYGELCRHQAGFRSKKCIDHGISGGILLYQLMNMHVHSQDKLTKSIKKFVTGKPILENHIASVAWTIMSHNIWTKKREYDENGKEKENNYDTHGLTELVYSDEALRFIQLEEHPLLFLFCLVDTIEPVKASSWGYLERMSVEVTDSLIEIKNHPKNELDLDFLFRNGHYENAKGNFAIKI